MLVSKTRVITQEKCKKNARKIQNASPMQENVSILYYALRKNADQSRFANVLLAFCSRFARKFYQNANTTHSVIWALHPSGMFGETSKFPPSIHKHLQNHLKGSVTQFVWCPFCFFFYFHKDTLQGNPLTFRRVHSNNSNINIHISFCNFSHISCISFITSQSQLYPFTSS